MLNGTLFPAHIDVLEETESTGFGTTVTVTAAEAVQVEMLPVTL